MATGNFILDKGYNAAAAITKFRAVKYSAAEEVTPVTAIGDAIAGFAQFSVTADELAAGKGASVRLDGITEAEVGVAAAIDVGDEVTMEADGRVGPLVAASGKRIVGVCVGHPSAGVVGDRISLRINLDGGLA